MPSVRMVLLATMLSGLLSACGGEIECVRAVNCIHACGGDVVATACLCPEGTFDELNCHADAGGN